MAYYVTICDAVVRGMVWRAVLDPVESSSQCFCHLQLTRLDSRYHEPLEMTRGYDAFVFLYSARNLHKMIYIYVTREETMHATTHSR